MPLFGQSFAFIELRDKVISDVPGHIPGEMSLHLLKDVSNFGAKSRRVRVFNTVVATSLIAGLEIHDVIDDLLLVVEVRIF